MPKSRVSKCHRAGMDDYTRGTNKGVCTWCSEPCIGVGKQKKHIEGTPPVEAGESFSLKVSLKNMKYIFLSRVDRSKEPFDKKFKEEYNGLHKFMSELAHSMKLNENPDWTPIFIQRCRDKVLADFPFYRDRVLPEHKIKENLTDLGL